MSRLVFEREGEYIVNRKHNIYLYQMGGHTGYIKMAAMKAGLKLYGQEGPASQLGRSNPLVSIIFPNGPDAALLQALRQNYRALIQEAAARRKSGEKKAATPQRVSRPKPTPKPLKRFLVFCDPAILLGPSVPTPSKEMEATSAYKAKELYELWYEQTYQRVAPYDLKARELKDAL